MTLGFKGLTKTVVKNQRTHSKNSCDSFVPSSVQYGMSFDECEAAGSAT